MKTHLFLFKILLLALLAFSQMACTDQCEETRTYRTTVPLNYTLKDIRQSIKTTAPRELSSPAKIYSKDNFLFISEAKKGIHVIDNSNPSSPKTISFIEIPGIIDMAIKNNTLYADSYIDLVAIDISNPTAVKEVGRVQNVFQNGLFDGINWYYDAYGKTIVDYEWKTVTETVKTNCGGVSTWPVYYGGSVREDALAGTANKNGSTTNGSTTGQGGSMARFTVYDNYLYTVSNTSLVLFDIEKEASPDSSTAIQLGWGIETIFPYKDKLFIGSNTGMFIFDNANPAKPKQLSVFRHARACDPVVVDGDVAFVTLREGWCGTAPNQLDVVDIKDLTAPRLMKSYPMKNPHGVGVNLPNLFVCEGEYGLKSLNATDVNNITEHQFIKDMDAFDVIVLDKRLLLMIGKDGLYQFDYSDPKNLKQLSVISVKK